MKKSGNGKSMVTKLAVLQAEAAGYADVLGHLLDKLKVLEAEVVLYKEAIRKPLVAMAALGSVPETEGAEYHVRLLETTTVEVDVVAFLQRCPKKLLPLIVTVSIGTAKKYASEALNRCSTERSGIPRMLVEKKGAA